MPRSPEANSARAAALEKVRTEAVIDPDTYGLVMDLGRGATYRALNAGSPIEPIRIGKKTFRIPTPPLRKLLHLEPAPKTPSAA